MISLDDYKNSPISKCFNEDVYPDDIEKSGREGLIPIKKMVHNPNGASYYRTYWCKPADIAHFNATAPAVEFLLKTLDSQKELQEMVDSLQSYNSQLSAEIYNQMAKNNEQAIHINDKVLSVASWDTSRETNFTAFLAGIKHLLNAQGSVNMGDLAKTYEEVSYQYRMTGLEIKNAEVEGVPLYNKKLSVTQELIPMGWTDKVKEVGAAIRGNIKEGLKTVRNLYNKLGKDTVPPLEEELDFRRKENAGKLDNLYAGYQGKKVLTDEQKLATEGVKPQSFPEEKKKFVVRSSERIKTTPIATPKLSKPTASFEKVFNRELKKVKTQIEALVEKLNKQYGTWEKVPKEMRIEFDALVSQYNVFGGNHGSKN